MISRFLSITSLTGVAVLFCTTGHAGYPGAPELHPELAQALTANAADGSTVRAPRSKNVKLLSFTPLEGIVSDVWAHRKHAYVGGSFFFGAFTPLRILDISRPRHPKVVAELPEPPGGFSSPQDVKVAKIRTKYFHGDLMVVGNDGGAGPPFGGIQLVDVSDPKNFKILSEPRIGPVHNVYLYQRRKRAFVLLAISFGEVFSGVFPPFEQRGDLGIIEVTDPSNPVIIADWGIGKDAGLAFGSPFITQPPNLSPLPTGFDCAPPKGTPTLCRGDDFPGVFLHDVWVNKKGTVAYLSYWDAGLILLDISDPSKPTLIGRGVEPETFGSDEGNAHNAVPAKRGRRVLVADEDFTPLPYGFLRVFNTREPSYPMQVGAFATQNSVTAPDPFPDFSIHNIFVRGNRAFISWYFDGIRVVNIRRAHNPREIAAYVPDSAPPTGYFWGVYATRHRQRNLILGSDSAGFFGATGGLHILKLKSGKF